MSMIREMTIRLEAFSKVYNQKLIENAKQFFGALEIVLSASFILALTGWIIYLIWPVLLVLTVVVLATVWYAKPWKSDHPDL